MIQHKFLKDELVPMHILPKICSTDEIVGSVSRANFGLPINAKLLASCGDLQCTVYPFIEPETAAASMNGGNAINLIAEKVVEWASQLISGTTALKIDYEKLYGILNEPEKCLPSTVTVKPVFISERVNNVLSCISGINSSTTVEELLHRTACGVISNLFRLLPPYQLRKWGIKRIILVGNANEYYFKGEIIRHCQGFLDVSLQ
ncbi:hypothetical protein DINM_000757 [Dirofilaria immitis]|nr:hypothetical protein [Dirofilaria immitis]